MYLGVPVETREDRRDQTKRNVDNIKLHIKILYHRKKATKQKHETMNCDEKKFFLKKIPQKKNCKEKGKLLLIDLYR